MVAVEAVATVVFPGIWDTAILDIGVVTILLNLVAVITFSSSEYFAFMPLAQ